MRIVLPFGLIALIGSLLYLPFLGNPPVFDDGVFYSGFRLAEYAGSPFGLGLRYPAQFSLAIVEVLWGRVEAHRLVSLALHVACGWALFALIREFYQGTLLPLAGAAWFVVHPAAVYAAGYLIQRSIVLATLFGLLAILAYVRGLKQANYAGAIAAALMYSMAVLSKEHALLVAAVAVAAAPLAQAPGRCSLRYAGIFLSACLPAAIFILLLSKGFIGGSNEPQFDSIAAEVSIVRGAEEASPWFSSMVAQAAMFFRYVAIWLVPQGARMAIDLKVDFAWIWAPAVAVPAVAGFLAWGAIGAWLLFRRGRVAIAGFGLLYMWILFLVEFSVVRYQEPFVLYRSYLWAPGLAIVLVALLGRAPRAGIAVLLGIAAAALPIQAYDRLTTFSSGRALWEDAVSRLPSAPIPGGSRSLYFLGREYLYADQPRKATEVVERCLTEYPASVHCQFARAAIHMHFSEFEASIPFLLRSIALQPKGGAARHHLGLSLENLGCIEQARAQYRAASRRGFVGGAYRLMRLDKPGSGMIAPSRKKRATCPPAIRNAALPPG